MNLIHGAEVNLPCVHIAQNILLVSFLLLNTILLWFCLVCYILLLFKAIPYSISVGNGKSQLDAEEGSDLITFELYQDYFAIGV